ncbi:MAG TPA: CRISPR-associated endonuclease Cas1 [Methanoculleus sp.]|nr:CRISPR-associated endonuclease Cas1 [Methanoculleus sp.]
MKMLVLNGHGIDMRVDNAKLHVREGRFSASEEPREFVFSPQRIDIDSIVIYGRTGTMTLDGIRWLMKHGVPVTILNWDGTLLTSMLPPVRSATKTKFDQYHAFEDTGKRITIAKKFIEAKIERQKMVLDYLHQRYPEVQNNISEESKGLKSAKTIREIMGAEGAVAHLYWDELGKIIPEKYEFETRNSKYKTRPLGAGDQVNCMFNFGYSLLEAECLRNINSVGLDSHVGFLHEMQTGKDSLAYDLQELFRFVVDLAIIHLIETDAMEKKDFIRTESYSLRLRPTGARKVSDEVNAWFNKTVEYQGKECMWSYVMLLKTRELAQYLTGKKRTLDFKSPEFSMDRQDSDEMRNKILDLSYKDWKDMGFSKGTLHYLKQNAKSGKPFTMNSHVRERIQSW